MSQIRVTKGKFVAMQGRQSITKTLMFNPTEVEDKKDAGWGTTDIPGASHPVYSFGSGGERLISFELYIDGDRGRVALGPKNGVKSSASLSIVDELSFYRALIYPSTYGSGVVDVFPYLCFFSMGPLYQNMPVIVKSVPWKIIYWTPKMEPVRAKINLTMAEVPSRSVVASEILAQGGFGLKGGRST